jgi:hypothetical protein
MDSGTSSHVGGKAGNLTATHSSLGLNSQHIIVDIGSKFHILAVGSVKKNLFLSTYKMFLSLLA